MIPNLKNKLSHLPKADIISSESKNIEYDFNCSTFTNSYDVSNKANRYDLSLFANIDIPSLKKACKIFNNLKINVEDIVFFDTETTGLSGGTGTVAFLIGIGRMINDRFVVKQFLMNDYHQETSLLNEFVDVLKGAKAVVTYNGKSFDAPLIKTRGILNQIDIKLDECIHFDLMHACRRVYAKRINRCKLSDIEEKILNIIRIDDVPGSEIPEIFFRYLKSKDKKLLDKVIEHNLYDILVLVQISGILSYSFKNPNEITFVEDKYCTARTLNIMRDYEKAEEIYKTIKDDYKPAKVDYAFMVKKNKLYEQAVNEFAIIAEESRFDIKYDIEIAKIAEHWMKNLELALIHTNIALDKINNIRLLGIDYNIIDNVKNRKERILRKMERLTQCH